MSATPGKVMVRDILEVNGEQVFALDLVQARDPQWANRLFFAAYDPEATWWDDLRPAFGADRFFFSDELAAMKDGVNRRRRHHLSPPTRRHGARPVPIDLRQRPVSQ